MSTTSPRLALTLPVNTDSMSSADNMLSTNYDNIDTNCHCRLVANQAAVTTPFNGQHIRSAADSANFFRKNGVWVASNSAPASLTPFKGSANNASAITVNASELEITQVTFTAVAGRKYLVRCCIDYASDNLVSETSVEITQRIRYAAGADVTTSGTLLHTKIFHSFLGYAPAITIAEFFPNANAQYTVGVYALRTAGTDAIVVSKNSRDSNIVVMDWGT